MTGTSQTPVEEVLDLLDLEKIEENIFRGSVPKDRMQRVFGGQVLGQALVAASRTVEGRVCHSFHAYFLRAGDPKVPILYEVDRTRDGASFTSRRVVAIQHGEQIFTCRRVVSGSRKRASSTSSTCPSVRRRRRSSTSTKLRMREIEKMPRGSA